MCATSLKYIVLHNIVFKEIKRRKEQFCIFTHILPFPVFFISTLDSGYHLV